MELNREAIDKVIRFASRCKQSRHPFDGKPLTLLPYQLEFIENVYGRIENSERLTKRACLWIPKKNGVVAR